MTQSSEDLLFPVICVRITQERLGGGYNFRTIEGFGTDSSALLRCTELGVD